MAVSADHNALLFSVDSGLNLASVPTCPPPDGGILLRILRAGICGTDMQILRRQREEAPSILGHEGVAMVLEARDSTSFTTGQLVTFNPTNPGNPSDILGHSHEGLFQELLTVLPEQVERGMLLPCDSSVPVTTMCLAEPLATALYSQYLALKHNVIHTAAVIGGGPVGLLLAVHLQACGNKVLVIHNTRQRLDWAINRDIIPADAAILSRDDMVSEVHARTGREGVDAVFLCTSRPTAPAALSHALEIVHDDGCIDLITGFVDNVSIPALPDIELNAVRKANHCGRPEHGAFTMCTTTAGKRVRLTGHRGVGELHLRAAMALLEQDPLRYSRVISQVVSLEAAAILLEQLRAWSYIDHRNIEYVKIVIDCTISGYSYQESVAPSYVS